MLGAQGALRRRLQLRPDGRPSSAGDGAAGVPAVSKVLSGTERDSSGRTGTDRSEGAAEGFAQESGVWTDAAGRGICVQFSAPHRVDQMESGTVERTSQSVGYDHSGCADGA